MQSIVPFSDAKEFTSAYLAMLDGLCSTYLAISQSQSPEAFEGRGVVIPESQVTVALSGQLDIEPHEGFAIHFKLLQARTRISPPFPLSRLFEKLNATDFQQLVILLALAPEFNRKYERIFAYLQDNINEKKATLGLAADLYSIIAPLPDSELYALYDSRHPINRYVLIPYSERVAASGLSRVLALRQTALLTLIGTAPLSEPLPSACTVLSAHESVEPMTGYGHLEQAARFVSYFLKGDANDVGLLQLYGSPGTGHRFTLQYVAAQLHTDVLCINCETLAAMPSEQKRTLMETAISYCFLTGSIPAAMHFDFPKLSEADRATLTRWILRELRTAGPVLSTLR